MLIIAWLLLLLLLLWLVGSHVHYRIIANIIYVTVIMHMVGTGYTFRIQCIYIILYIYIYDRHNYNTIVTYVPKKYRHDLKI